MQKQIYAIYDKDKTLITVFDTIKEVAEFLNTSVGVLHSRKTRTLEKNKIELKHYDVFVIPSDVEDV